MQALALDLDRVLFDTNAYINCLRQRFNEAGLDFDQVAEKCAVEGRKDLSSMVKLVASQLGQEKAELLFFQDVKNFWPGGAAEVFESLRDNFHAIFVITVGDGYQSRKIEGLDIDGLFVMDSDSQKVEVAAALKEKYPGLIFVDDKASVVEQMTDQEVRAFQALWFLDAEHQKKALSNSLKKPEAILDL